MTCAAIFAGNVECVDLLVVGGSVDNVRVAAEAARKGEKVLLATAWPYLGDDMAATLELGFGGGVPDDPLLRRMWTSSSDLAPFDYTPDRRSDGIRYIYHNDRLDRLSEPGRPPSPADSVWYTGDVSFKCRLRGAARVSTVEVLVLTTRKMADDGVTAEQANDPSRNTLAATASVEGTVAGGSADGRRLVFRNCGRAFTVRGDYYRGDADAVSFVADVDEEIGGANLVVRQDPAASRQLVSRIWLHRAGAERTVSIPTPLKVKRVLDAELMESGASFITLSPVRRVFRSADGTPEGKYVIVIFTILDGGSYPTDALNLGRDILRLDAYQADQVAAYGATKNATTGELRLTGNMAFFFDVPTDYDPAQGTVTVSGKPVALPAE